jgi:hypothetical protein
LRHAIHICGLRATLGDVADLAASVAGLSLVVRQRTAVGRGAIPRDVAELAAGVALHGLRLAVAGVVVRPAALVAGRRSWGRAVAAAAASSVASAAAAGGAISGRAVALSMCKHAARLGDNGTDGNVAGLVAFVATTRPATQAQRWAVGLHMADALAVVALFSCGQSETCSSLCNAKRRTLSGSRMGACVALMA